MKLKVSQLDPGENTFHFRASKDKWLKGLQDQLAMNGFPLNTELDVELTVTKLDPDFVFRGDIAFEANLPCDRCAEPFPLPIKNHFDLAFVRAGSQENELDETLFEGDEIDLIPILEEQFHLSLPFALICKENCKGICQNCGQNLNQGRCDCAVQASGNTFSELAKLRDSGR